MMDPSSPVYQRAPVIGHTLWVTAHDDEERWPAGDYPTQREAGERHPRWIAADASLENTDVVLWYVFGIHHITRVEDWPIMPADTVSFWLKPFGFFDPNPSLDVAPAPTSAHCHPPLTKERPAVSDKKTFVQLHRRRVRAPAASGDVLDIVNPSTGEVYATSPKSKRGRRRRRLPGGRGRAFEKWRWTTPSERTDAPCSSWPT